ncbi:MAG: adenosylmethionine decarboxylase [Spirochaetota bacterium]|nr:adenosylmethionine decarboxylase [Spirochaetota bacterium]
MEGLGTQVIVELFDCNKVDINNTEKVKEIMLNAARISKATIIEHIFHKFSPHGISGVIVISESHFTIHTWPEYGYVAVDIFTCGDFDYKAALDYIKTEFRSERSSVFNFQRGILPEIFKEEQRSVLMEKANAGCLKERRIP